VSLYIVCKRLELRSAQNSVCWNASLTYVEGSLNVADNKGRGSGRMRSRSDRSDGWSLRRIIGNGRAATFSPVTTCSISF
jgi:hypothetical protein